MRVKEVIYTDVMLARSHFSLVVVPHQFLQLWQRRYHDTTDMRRCRRGNVCDRGCMEGRGWRWRRKKETLEVADWQHLRTIHSLVHEPVSVTLQQYHNSCIPLIQIPFPLWPWGKVTEMLPCTQDIIKRDETTYPRSLRSKSRVFRATRSHDNCFLNRWVNGYRCCSAEEEDPPFKLSRCHVNPLGGWERERTACGESKNKRAAGSSGG